MPKFIVSGYDRETAEPVQKVVSAESQDQAVSVSNFVVEDVRQIGMPDARYQGAGPRFEQLRYCAYALRIGGLLCIMFSIFRLFSIMIGTMGKDRDVEWVLYDIAIVFFMIMLSVFVYSAGECCMALKHIAERKP